MKPTLHTQITGRQLVSTPAVPPATLPDEGELEWSEPGTEERAAPGWKAAMDRRHPGHNTA